MGIPTKSFNIAGGHHQATGNMTVRINPVAIVTILDSDARRPETATRTIGTLLGFFSEGNVVEVTDAFPVPHEDATNDSNNVLMDKNYYLNMVALRNKVSPKEVVVGWFSTGKDINESTVQVHSFFGSQESTFTAGPVLQSPLFLVVNTNVIESKSLPIKAYLSTPTSVAENLAQFHEVPSTISANDPSAKMGLTWLYEAIMKTKTTGELDELDIFTNGLVDLEKQFSRSLEYINQVKQNKIPGDLALGRAISRALEEVPNFNKAGEGLSGERSLAGSNVMDSLMVTYLSNLAQVQMSLADKVSKLPGTDGN